jgi:hypothetical protein
MANNYYEWSEELSRITADAVTCIHTTDLERN